MPPGVQTISPLLLPPSHHQTRQYSNRAPSAHKAKGKNRLGKGRGPSPPTDEAGNASEAAASPNRLRHSLAELARRGMDSEWSKDIDADVARTFGRRPMSFRGVFGSGAQQVRVLWDPGMGMGVG